MMDLVVPKTIGVVDSIKVGKEFKKMNLRRHWKSEEAKLKFGGANWTCFGIWFLVKM